MERMRIGLNKTGLLLVGDCKMSAWETRTHVVGHHDFSLAPLPVTGATAAAMAAWIAEGVTQHETGELERICRLNDRGQEVRAAEGYEFERTCCAQVGEEAWRERVVVGRSPVHAARQVAG